MSMGSIIVSRVGKTRRLMRYVGSEQDAVTRSTSYMAASTAEVHVYPFEMEFEAITRYISTNGGVTVTLEDNSRVFIPAGQIIVVFAWDHSRPTEELNRYVSSLSF